MMSIKVHVHQAIESQAETDDYPVVVNDSIDEDYHLFKVQMKGTDATLRYYPSKAQYVVIAGSLIRKESTDSFRNRAAIEKRNEIFSNKASYRDLGESVELLHDVVFNLEAPNTPTQFCTGRSTNATIALFDEEGRTFAEVYSEGQEAREVVPPSITPVNTPQGDNFRDSCISRLMKVTGQKLFKKSVSTYLSKDGKTGYVFRTSKIYKQGSREKYW
jgi:hypothetical protein